MAGTDRELLELAAKAIYGAFAVQMIESGWNPRNNNADAFALAVKLRMDVGVYFTDTRVTAADVFICEYHGVDPEGATRLAIVKAAAEIGKDMK